jgi:hypothetical protein
MAAVVSCSSQSRARGQGQGAAAQLMAVRSEANPGCPGAPRRGMGPGPQGPKAWSSKQWAAELNKVRESGLPRLVPGDRRGRGFGRQVCCSAPRPRFHWAPPPLPTKWPRWWPWSSSTGPTPSWPAPPITVSLILSQTACLVILQEFSRGSSWVLVSGRRGNPGQRPPPDRAPPGRFPHRSRRSTGH